MTLAIAVDLMITDGQDFAGVVFYSLLFGAPWVGGRLIRVSRQREALLEEQRDEQARAAVADDAAQRRAGRPDVRRVKRSGCHTHKRRSDVHQTSSS
jgi:hypothetical protein